jgi:hypothetical protein
MLRRTLPLLALFLVPAFARADDVAQPTPSAPAVVIRLAPLDTLYDDLKLVGNMLGQKDLAHMLDEAIKAKLGPKGLYGIDGKRPLAFYATIGKDISDISGVLMVPITTEKNFKKMLEALDWKVTAGKDGIHTVKQDLLPMDVQYRVANNYAYVGLLGQQDELLKPANLLAPEKVFTGKQPAAVALSVRIDRIPEEARDALLMGIIENLGGMADPKKGGGKKGPKSFEDTIKGEFERILTNVFKDGEELTALIDIDSKAKQLVAEVSLTARANSELAKNIKSLGQRKTLFAGVLDKKAAVNGLVSFELPKGLREAFDQVVQDAKAKVLADTKDEKKKEQARKLLDALAPSLTTGDIDAGFSLRGPHKNKTYTFVAGFRLKEGNKLAAAVFELLKDLPESEQKLIKLNADQEGNVMIHRFDLHQVIAEAKDFVGDNPLYFAIRDDALFVAIGDDGQNAIKDAVKAGPTDTAPARFEVGLARLAMLFDKGDGTSQRAAALLKKGDDARLVLTVEGGTELRLRFTMNLSVLQLFADRGVADKGK